MFPAHSRSRQQRHHQRITHEFMYYDRTDNSTKSDGYETKSRCRVCFSTTRGVCIRVASLFPLPAAGYSRWSILPFRLPRGKMVQPPPSLLITTFYPRIVTTSHTEPMTFSTTTVVTEDLAMSSSATIAARWWSGKESLFPWIPKPGESTSSRGTTTFIVLNIVLIMM